MQTKQEQQKIRKGSPCRGTSRHVATTQNLKVRAALILKRDSTSADRDFRVTVTPTA
jgi:hypothetical protein